MQKKGVKIVHMIAQSDVSECKKQLEKIYNYQSIKEEAARLWEFGMWMLTELACLYIFFDTVS